jgi:phage shock protein PspC (stress-responsive transcriptional regulator)
MEKKLYRIKHGKKLAGVCGGIAEYLNMDPSVVRVLWAIVSLCAGTGVLAYIVCAFVIPEKPDQIIDAV